jgi:hypothetical protein
MIRLAKAQWMASSAFRSSSRPTTTTNLFKLSKIKFQI